MSKYQLAKQMDTPNSPWSLENQLLGARGLTEPGEIEEFLNPNYDTGRHDPFLLNDMDVAVKRILKAISAKEKITIFSDYDCDGIPGAVVLHDFFKAVGYTNFTNYIPHRHYEGFGLNAEAITKIQAEGSSLIITIDCGTGNIEAVKHANELGVEVIITDHHEPKSDLPTAVAIVNPKLGGKYPFPDLCGAGVIYKLVEALIARGNFDLKPGWEKWWLDMVGIATISDMVPLRGENRIFAKYGLEVLRKSRRPGLHHLLRKARASQRHLTEDDIGFTIGPRINAASRMDSPEDAFLMLTATDEAEAGARVGHLEHLNNERKGMVSAMTKELKKRMKEMDVIPRVLVLGNPAWRPALVGLAANSLAEEYHRPAFLWGRDGNGVLKGSCRSEGNTSVVKLMETASEHFTEHGGHHMSGGFAVEEESIFNLSTHLNAAYDSLGEQALANNEVTIDAYLELSDVNADLFKTLRKLAPFGMGNAKPLFGFKDVVPTNIEVFGKAKEHLKLVFARPGGQLEAIAFFANVESYEVAPAVGERVTLLAYAEESFFMNRLQTRLRIVDVIKSSV